MFLLTIYALFFDDFRIIFLSKAWDNFVYSMTCFTLFSFTIEMVLYSYARPDYRLSFFFWLDVVQSLSLLLDVGWLFDGYLFSSHAATDVM